MVGEGLNETDSEKKYARERSCLSIALAGPNSSLFLDLPVRSIVTVQYRKYPIIVSVQFVTYFQRLGTLVTGDLQVKSPGSLATHKNCRIIYWQVILLYSSSCVEYEEYSTALIRVFILDQELVRLIRLRLISCTGRLLPSR